MVINAQVKTLTLHAASVAASGRGGAVAVAASTAASAYGERPHNTNRPAGDRNGGSSEDSVSGDDAVSEKIPRGTSVLLMWRTALLHGVRSSTVHWHYPWESNACRSFLNRTCFGTVGPASHCSIEDRE